MEFEIFGIQLHPPSWLRLSIALLIGALLWLALMSSPLAASDAKTAGGHLVAILYGTCTSCLGLRPSRGVRYVVVYVLGLAALAAAYSAIAWLVF